MNAAKHARRGLGLCGYGNPNFDKMADDLAYIYKLFKSAGIGDFERLDVPEFFDYFALDASNNYFTAKKEATLQTYRRYPPDEDPFGVLHSCAESSENRMAMVRLKENEILYFKKHLGIDTEGKP